MGENTEKIFLSELCTIDKRLDGRERHEYRGLCISYGIERGSCKVLMGKTRVLAAVSCHVTTPSIAANSEGKLRVDVDSAFTPMFPDQDRRNCPKAIETRKTLEAIIKQNQVVNLESLCLIAEQKVWQLTLQIHLLNDEGNILDCAYIAAIAALHHFRLPQTSISGTNLIIHTSDERVPVPLTFNHVPFLVTWLIFEPSSTSTQLLATDSSHPQIFYLLDGSTQEFRCCSAYLSIAVNLFKELCYINLESSTVDSSSDISAILSSTPSTLTNHAHGLTLNRYNISQMSYKVYEVAKQLENIIKRTLEIDEEKRSALQKRSILQGIESKCTNFPYHSDESQQPSFLLNVSYSDIPQNANMNYQILDDSMAMLNRWLIRNFNADIELSNTFSNSVTVSPQPNPESNVQNSKQSQSSKNYVHTWFSEIPELKTIEATNKLLSRVKKFPPTEGITTTRRLPQGLNFRIGQVDDPEVELHNSEEEIDKMTDIEIDQKYKPKQSNKEFRPKKKNVKSGNS